MHPDGRLLACAMSDGFGLWDLATGAELGFIPSEWRNNFVRFEPSGALLTLSYAGLSRWPIGTRLDATGELSVGPPEPLPLPNGEDLDQSRDGRVIVTGDRSAATQLPYAGGWILHADRTKEPIRLDPGADIRHIAISPDGRWVVTATHAIGLAKIWDARDGRLVKQLANWGAHFPRFSPDGRWLSTWLDGGRLFAVESWEPGLRLGESAVFAPDSKLAAVPTAAGLRLLDVASGREVALLEDPNPDAVSVPVFTPDGTKVITVNRLKGIHVWDLRLIRRGLQDLSLDWKWPEFAAVAAARQITEPVKMEIHIGSKWVAGPPEEPADKKPDKPQSKPAS
jgi:WD40 repeat protein